MSPAVRFFARPLWLLLVSSLLLCSCSGWEDDWDFSHLGIRDHEADWVANLVDADLSIGDFVPDTVDGEVSLVTDPGDSYFFLSYTMDYHTDTLNVRRWLQFDTISGSEVRYIINPAVPTQDEITVDAPLTLDFAMVDTVHMKGGMVELFLSTPLDTHGMRAELVSNLLWEKVGGKFTPCRQAVHFGQNQIPLDDKYLILNDSHLIRINVTYQCFPFTGAYADSLRAPINVRYKVHIPDYHYVTGEVFRDTSFELANGKVEYSLLEGKSDCGFHLNHLILHTDVATSVGIPLYCEVGHLKYHNNSNNKTYDFLTTGKYAFHIRPPKFRGEVAHTADSLQINRETVFSNDGYLDFSAYAGVKKGRFFLDENARYDVNAHLDFPLDLTIEHFRYVDTLDFSGLGGADTAMDGEGWRWIQSLDFRYEFVNGIPVDLGVQLYFTDSNYRIIDSLFVERTLLKGAETDPLTDLVVRSVSSGVHFISIDRERVKRIAPAKYVLLQASAVSPQGRRVILAANQRLRVRIGAKVHANVNYKTR